MTGPRRRSREIALQILHQVDAGGEPVLDAGVAIGRYFDHLDEPEDDLLKQLVRRAQPALEDLPALTPVISGRSYPSAHASTSFARARALSAALPAGPLYGLAVAMALSRPYLGVHYPTDVLVGA